MWESWGPYYTDRRDASLHIERLEDANAIAVLLPAVKNFSDFELLVSTIHDRVLRHSTTGGTCYAYDGKGGYRTLHHG